MIIETLKQLVDRFRQTLAFAKRNECIWDPATGQCFSKLINQKLLEFENNTHGCGDPVKIAQEALKACCDFYQADWCCVLGVNEDLGVLLPFWWHIVKGPENLEDLMQVGELAENGQRWMEALRQNKTLMVPDIEVLKKTVPEEYRIYKEREICCVMGVPFHKRSSGFVLVANPRRYFGKPDFVQRVTYVIASEVNEKKLLDKVNAAAAAGREIMNPNDVRINLFGGLEVITFKGKLTEKEICTGKGCEVLVYLLLNRGRKLMAKDIAEKLRPTEYQDDQCVSKVRGNVFSLRRKLDHVLLDEGVNLLQTLPKGGYELNPALNITMDLDEFNEYYTAADKMAGTASKIEVLKKAAALYKGSVFTPAATEQWLVEHDNLYRLRYYKIMDELFTLLDKEGAYADLYEYSMVALKIDDTNVDFWYWNILSLRRSGSMQLARKEFGTAKDVLPDEEFQELILMLQEENSKKACGLNV